VVLAVGAALLYARTYQHELLESWDDGVFVISNPVLLDPGGLQKIWSTLEMPDSYPNYPLVFTTYWFETQIGGINVPKVGQATTGVSLFHITNLILHSICTSLVFLVVRHLGFGTWGAWFVGLLFAVHPIQVESVAWVTERKNVLSGAFYLATFLCYRLFREKRQTRLYVLTLGMFVLALLSKTASVTLPASLWLADVLIDRRKALPSLGWVAPMLVLGGVAALATVMIEQEDTRKSMALPLRPLLMSGTSWFYFYKLVVPWNYLAVYPRWQVTAANVGLWLCLIGWVSVGVGVFIFRKRLDRRVLWGAGHFWVTILPISGMVHYGYLAHTYVADRFVYLAGIGVFVIVVAGLEILNRKIGSARASRGLTVGVTAVLAIGLGTVSYVQIGYWRDNMSLWQHTLDHNPESYDAHFNLGKGHNDIFLHLNRNDKTNSQYPEIEAKAIGHYEETIRIKPSFSKAHNNLANIYIRRGDFERALHHFNVAIRVKPDYHKALNNRAFALGELGRIDEAIEGFQQAIESKPEYAKAYINLASFLNKSGRSGEVLGWLERGFAENRSDPDLTFYLASAYKGQGRLGEAMEMAELALRLSNARGERERARSAQRLIQAIAQLQGNAPK
jgi:tetratricopeptide (TPR) repeat protein